MRTKNIFCAKKVTSTVKSLIAILFSIFILFSCARIGSPQGGPEDKSPPGLIDELSTENYQTNFFPETLEFTFDEWIVVQNPSKEIVVSPPLDQPFTVNTKGKTVSFEFSELEKLKENVTYQINFGDAIKDFTANNVFKNFVYVFSTGDVIDSLEISGTVVNALDKSPAKDVIVMLYENMSDTAFFTTKPFYFSKTNESGQFKLKNLRSDTFQVFALSDNNVNYYYDQDSELVGFLDSTIFLDTIFNDTLKLELFDEIDETRLIESVQEVKGQIRLAYNPMPDKFLVTNENSDTLNSVIEKDSLIFWHNDLSSDSSLFFVFYDDKIDTIKNKRAKLSMKDQVLSLNKQQKPTINTILGDTIKLSFTTPLSEIDTSLIQVKDSIKNPKLVYVDSKDLNLLLYYSDLEIDSSYQLELYPGAITNLYAQSNSDTLKFNVNTKSPDKLGSITINLIEASNSDYVLELIKGQKTVSIKRIKEDKSTTFKRLESGQYELKIIEDLNQDGKWTPGSIKERRQSERVKTVSLEELNAGWDLNSDLKIKEIFDGTKG